MPSKPKENKNAAGNVIHDPEPINVEADINRPAGQDPTLETPHRDPGQDPNPLAEPNEAASAETPDATATPPQRVQWEKSNAASMITPAAKATGDPNDTGRRYRVKVLRGIHMEGGRTYNKGDIVESTTDLVGRFGTEKFASAD